MDAAAAALLLLLGVASPSVEARTSGPYVLGAEVTAFELSSPEVAARMRIVYHLRPRSALELSLTFLGTPSSRIEGLRAELDPSCQGDSENSGTRPMRVGRESESGPLQRVTVALPEDLEPETTVCLSLHYGVAAWSPRPPQARLPLLVIEGGTVADEPELFTAEIVVEPGIVLTDSFPSDFDREPASGAITYRTQLPVVPAFLQFDLHRGAGPILTVSRLADAITVSALVLVLALAWHRFRSLEQ